VHLGHVLPRGSDAEWATFSVANAVLGFGSGRISLALGQKGLATGAIASATWRPDASVWEAVFDARTDAVVDAIREVLAQVERMRTEMVPAAELDKAKGSLLGPIVRPADNSGLIAGQTFLNRVRGQADDAQRVYRDRVQAVDASDVEQIAAEWLHPDRMTIVVAGDAAVLADNLAKLGPVSIVDADGDSLDTSVVFAKPTGEKFDASILRPGAFEYRLMLQGNVVGAMKRELVADTVGGASMAFRGTITLGPQTIDQEVVFGIPDFDARAARVTMDIAGQRVDMDARMLGRRLIGSVRVPTGSQPVDREVPPGTLIADMVELAVWIADLEVGKVIGVPVASLENGGVETQVMRVQGIEDVTVPAGTFKAYKVQIVGSEPQTVWARVDSPHVLLKLAPAGQPLTIELVSLPR
jgi:hypothetical protein